MSTTKTERAPRRHTPESRQRDVERSKQWAAAVKAVDPEKYAAERRATFNRYRAKHPDRVKRQFRTWVLKTKYGLTQEQCAEKLAAQAGGCDICGTKDPGGRGNSFHVDHDHETGAVRSLLCTNCNSGLGRLKDSPRLLRRAATY